EKFSGVYNSPILKEILPFPYTLIKFVRVRLGFMTQTGNPKSIRRVDDLTRPDVMIINRQEGSGSRGLLHRLMNDAKITSPDIRGHDYFVSNHMEIARVVRTGLVDCGIGVEAAARISDLSFVPICEEPYDLVIPNHFLDLPAVSTLLDILKSRELISHVEALGGYDAISIGTYYN
ncbi:MAG TPA: substrate-binding domain-containing protein, partial [Dehalococcoidales bacterium]|nr:substrate-binding domain-containing protein [Dehalococcoidales bacterium]